jgi:hypothetical protein
MYAARVLADSLPPDGLPFKAPRLLTVEVTFPRMVLAEFNTHRVFSRNSASSRAIPVVKQLRRVLEEPFIPEEFGTHKAGMQAGPALEGRKAAEAAAEWMRARDRAVRSALALLTSPKEAERATHEIGRLNALDEKLKADPPEDWLAVHKQIANRLLEPFMWHTVIVSATEWDNFFALRDHPQAQPEIRRAAEAMREAMLASTPTKLPPGAWHLPLVTEHEMNVFGLDVWSRGTSVASAWRELAMVSAGRCARVSFDRQGEYEDPEESRRRAEKLLQYGHMSPFEHPAQPHPTPSGNFRGWQQFRGTIANEDNLVGVNERRADWETST